MTKVREPRVSLETAKRLQSVWADSDSLGDAVKRAGLTAKDPRSWHRIRRATEALLGITLVAHNSAFSTHDQDTECPSTLDVKKARSSKRFIVTSCTNDSPLVEDFVLALEAFAKHYGAQMLVVPVPYKNPNAAARAQGYNWPAKIYPYVVQSDLLVSKSLMISGMRLQATAVNPLSGLNANSGSRSAIYGHPQLSMQMVASPTHELPKKIQTTGSINRPRYSASKAGGKAKQFHETSAVFVITDGSKFYDIDLIWSKGRFHFLDQVWTEDGLGQSGVKALAIERGDDHAIYADKSVIEARARVCDLTQPGTHIFNDVFDAESINHHNTFLDKIELSKLGRDSLEAELEITAKHIVNTGGKVNLIKDSNHDRAIERYLNEGRFMKDPKNAAMAAWLLSEIVKTGKSALEIYLHKSIRGKFKFLDSRKRHMIGGYDVSQHGHQGANGSRGSLKAFSNYIYPVILGHSHTPGRHHHCLQVGCTSRNARYSDGYSSWLEGDALIYANNTAVHVHYIGGKSIADMI